MHIRSALVMMAIGAGAAGAAPAADAFSFARERVSSGRLSGVDPALTALGMPGATPVAFCVAPGTDPAYADDFAAWVASESGFGERYFLGGRWSVTANGSTPPQGQGVALTYSFPSDGLAGISGGQTSVNVLNQKLIDWYGSVAAGKARFRDAFSRWEAVSGLRYTEVSDDNAGWGAGGVLGVRGDVRIASITIDGPGGVLAFNFFPNNGDMVVDSADGFNSQGFFANVVTHESGHGWGAQHVCPANGTKIMEPFANGIQTPPLDDKRAVQLNYGDTYEPNNSIAQATNVGSINSIETNVPDASVVAGGEDYFRFTIATRGTLRVTAVVEDQFPYQSYAQTSTCPGGPNNVSPATISRLGLTLYASNGTTVLQDVSSTLGFNVAVGGQTVNPNDQFYVRVRGLDGTFDTQLYRLVIRSEPPLCPGDTNGDNIVNFADLNAVLGQFGQTGPGLAADVNGDGVVNFADLNLVLSNFGRTC